MKTAANATTYLVDREVAVGAVMTVLRTAGVPGAQLEVTARAVVEMLSRYFQMRRMAPRGEIFGRGNA